MRFLHKDASLILSHVLSRDLIVARIDSAGRDIPLKVAKSEITDMFELSKSLWGDTLPYYLRVAELYSTDAYSLIDAVDVLENDTGNTGFLVTAYQDGGLITISSHLLDFQNNIPRADWWKPPVNKGFLSFLYALFAKPI